MHSDEKYTAPDLDSSSFQDIGYYALCLIRLRQRAKVSRSSIFRDKHMTDSQINTRLWQAIPRGGLDRSKAKAAKQQPQAGLESLYHWHFSWAITRLYWCLCGARDSIFPIRWCITMYDGLKRVAYYSGSPSNRLNWNKENKERQHCGSVPHLISLTSKSKRYKKRAFLSLKRQQNSCHYITRYLPVQVVFPYHRCCRYAEH